MILICFLILVVEKLLEDGMFFNNHNNNNNNTSDEEGLWAMDIDSSGFEETLRCRAASTHPDEVIRERLLYGGKMLLPQSCLETLSSLNVVYPLQFKLLPHHHQRSASASQAPVRTTYLGVLEFSAPEGTAYLPDWALDALGIKDRGLIDLTNVSLPTGRFVKFQPTSTSFLLDISDPRAVLEHTLRNYSCFTRGDIVCFSYLGQSYGLRVEEVRPDDGRGAILAVETDLQVDFSPPPGYVEPDVPSPVNSKSLVGSLGKSPTVFSTSSCKSFSAFTGASNKLKSNCSTTATAGSSDAGEVKPVKLPPGALFFSAAASTPPASVKSNSASTTSSEKKSVFESGRGQVLKKE